MFSSKSSLASWLMLVFFGISRLNLPLVFVDWLIQASVQLLFGLIFYPLLVLRHKTCPFFLTQ